MWFLVISLAFVLAAPFLLEYARLPMNPSTRHQARGDFAELSQGITHYELIGPQDGKLIVCVHGLTTPSFVWRGLAPSLALLGYRVLVYDLYGRGFSDRPRGRQSEAFFLRQLTELLSELRIGNGLTLMGYSMGGAIVTAFAARYPARVDKVILIAPAGLHMARGKLLDFVIKVPVLGDWLMLVSFPRKHRAGTEAERDLDISVPNLIDMQQEELSRRGFVFAVLSSLRGILSDDQTPLHNALKQASIPVTAIFAENDDVIPLEAKDRFEKSNPFASVHVVKGAGHGVAYTHADQVLEIIAGEIGEA